MERCRIYSGCQFENETSSFPVFILMSEENAWTRHYNPLAEVKVALKISNGKGNQVKPNFKGN